MRVLLTGWRGYVGGAALAAARGRGHDVTVLVRSDEEAGSAASQGLRTARGDLADPASLAPAVAEAEAVIHCAASDAPAFQPVNHAAVAAMMASLPAGARFVMHGGSLVFGPTGPEPAHPVRTAPPPFLAARAAIDQLVLDAAAAGKRAGGVYGSFVHGGGPGAAIPASWAAASRAAGRVAVPCAGGARWSTCHVADWAALLVLTAESLEPQDGPVFAAAYSACIADIAAELSHQLALPLVEVGPGEAAAAGPFGAALLLDQMFDAAAARARFGWKPQHGAIAASLIEGL
jgi:nucleoside-diphosphate-sugar epimerase